MNYMYHVANLMLLPHSYLIHHIHLLYVIVQIHFVIQYMLYHLPIMNHTMHILLHLVMYYYFKPNHARTLHLDNYRYPILLDIPYVIVL